jgi:ArsR family transcriptional regulator
MNGSPKMVAVAGQSTANDTLARMLRILGEPTRLAIFDLLMGGVHCNCEISEQLGLSLSLVSHHLRVLRKVGLVHAERAPEDARWIYYSIDQEALARLGQSIDHLLDVDRIQPRQPWCGPRTCAKC